MKFVNSLMVIGSVFLINIIHVKSDDILKVSVYYESLCPHSIGFIKNQLLPAYKKIGEHFDVDLVPYGKATQNWADGQWSFQCQHGVFECYGNKLQACALQIDHPQSVMVPFIACVMSSLNPASNDEVQKCAAKHGISWELIKSCMTGDDVDNLLAALGDRTHAVTPKITYVPTIIFNDVYDKKLQNGAERNFLQTACGLLENKPENCP